MFHERDVDDDGDVPGVNGNTRYVVCKAQINTKSVAADNGWEERALCGEGGGGGEGESGGGFGEGVLVGGAFVSHKPIKPAIKVP